MAVTNNPIDRKMIDARARGAGKSDEADKKAEARRLDEIMAKAREKAAADRAAIEAGKKGDTNSKTVTVQKNESVSSIVKNEGKLVGGKELTDEQLKKATELVIEHNRGTLQKVLDCAPAEVKAEYEKRTFGDLVEPGTELVIPNDVWDKVFLGEQAKFRYSNGKMVPVDEAEAAAKAADKEPKEPLTKDNWAQVEPNHQPATKDNWAQVAPYEAKSESSSDKGSSSTGKSAESKSSKDCSSSSDLSPTLQAINNADKTARAVANAAGAKVVDVANDTAVAVGSAVNTVKAIPEEAERRSKEAGVEAVSGLIRGVSTLFTGK